MNIRRISALAAAFMLLLAGCAELAAREPDEAGEVFIELTDNRFSPDVVRVKAGDQVTFVLTNSGDHEHEFMVGRDPVFNDNYLVDEVVEAFEVDFFEGVEISFSGEGMPMNFSGLEEMGDMDMGDEDMDMDDEGEHAEDEMAGDDMGDMDMGDEDMDMDEEAEHAEDEDEHAEDEMAGDDMGDMDMGEEAAGHDLHTGAMVMLSPGATPAEPGQTSTITLVIPEDRVGTWRFGCFQEAGQHYEDGMRGTLIVEEA